MVCNIIFRGSKGEPPLIRSLVIGRHSQSQEGTRLHDGFPFIEEAIPARCRLGVDLLVICEPKLERVRRTSTSDLMTGARMIRSRCSELIRATHTQGDLIQGRRSINTTSACIVWPVGWTNRRCGSSLAATFTDAFRSTVACAGRPHHSTFLTASPPLACWLDQGTWA